MCQDRPKKFGNWLIFALIWPKNGGKLTFHDLRIYNTTKLILLDYILLEISLWLGFVEITKSNLNVFISKFYPNFNNRGPETR